MELMIYGGIVTALGTAVLTVASVWKLVMGPLQAAIDSIKDSLARLEGRIDASEAKRESDIKDLWKYLAEKGERDR